MASTASLDIDLTNFILGGLAYRASGTIAQDAGRSAALVQYTVLAYDTTNENFVPLTDVDALDGTNVPSAIYMGADIAAATIVAGDVDLQPADLLIGGHCKVDKNKVVLENSLTLASICLYVDTGGTNGSLGSIEQNLRKLGIFMGDVVDASDD